ncbi:hypothetical protein OROMI_009007 [Orobanche minor]
MAKEILLHTHTHSPQYTHTYTLRPDRRPSRVRSGSDARPGGDARLQRRCDRDSKFRRRPRRRPTVTNSPTGLDRMASGAVFRRGLRFRNFKVESG